MTRMNGNSENIAILLCGGSGERFGSTLPKQYLSFNGKPLLYYALYALEQSAYIDSIYVVAKPDTMDLMRNILVSFRFKKAREIIGGGATRQESVFAALSRLHELGADEGDVVLIQDGDRPNLKERFIKEGIEKAREAGASITAIPASDSMFLSEEGEVVDRYMKRSEVYRGQTPQTFVFPLIYKAHERFHKKGEPFTDDASMVLALHEKVAIVIGSENNYKINTVEDGKRFEEERRRA